MNDETLENSYREALDERIITCLSEKKKWPLDKAVDRYYRSRMADMIGKGECGVQYLDYKVIVDIMLETESALFS
ncbi:MAG: hypothetical protein IJT56_03770 [Clostridia bacterium]|nr:hypothetical protein [Clostridia bacterium]